MDPWARIEGNVAFAHNGAAALRMHISDCGPWLIVKKVSAEAEARHDWAAALWAQISAEAEGFHFETLDSLDRGSVDRCLVAMAAENSFLFHALDFLHKVGDTLLERQLFSKELFTQLLFLLQVLVGLGGFTLIKA
jgi:hypothetical protein